MDGALNAELARPGHHLARSGSVFHTAQPNLSQHGDAGCGQIFEILLDHPVLDHGRAGVASSRRPGRNAEKARCAKMAMRFQPDDILRTAGGVHFTRGDHAS